MEYYAIGFKWPNKEAGIGFRTFHSNEIIFCDENTAKNMLETVKFASDRDYKLYRIELEEVA